MEILVILSDVFVIILWPMLAPALCPHQDSANNNGKSPKIKSLYKGHGGRERR